MPINGPTSVGARAFRGLTQNWVSGSLPGDVIPPVVAILSPGVGRRIVITSYSIDSTGPGVVSILSGLGAPLIVCNRRSCAEHDDRGLVAGDDNASIEIQNTLTGAVGGGEPVTLAYSVPIGVTNIVAAPGAGRRIRIYAVVTKGATGALDFRDETAGTVRLNLSSTTLGRPIAYSLAGGIAVFGDNEGIDVNSVAANIGTIVYGVEPVSASLSFRITYVIEPTDGGASP